MRYHSRIGFSGWQCWQPRAGRLSSDRRGVTAVVFAICATVFLGMVGLATEVGAWYVGRLEAHGVADALALAGALAAAAPQGSPGATFDPASDQTVLPFKATFPHATIAVVTSDSSNPTATTVRVSVPFSPLLAALFTSEQTVTVAATGEAVVAPINTACALSLTDLTISQNQLSYGGVDGWGCYYASNSTNLTAVSFIDNASITTGGITTPGDCAQCPLIAFNPPNNAPQSVLTGGIDKTGQSEMYRPNSSYQYPTAIVGLSSGGGSAGALSGNLSYPAIDGLSLPTVSSIICPTGLPYDPPLTSGQLDSTTHCPTTATPATVMLTAGVLVPSVGDGTVGIDVNSSPTCAPVAGQYCAYYNMNVVVPSNVTVVLAPPAVGDSTYLFINSSLTVQGGGTLLCLAEITPGSWADVTSGLSSEGLLPCAPGPQNQLGHSVSPLGSRGVTIILGGSSVGALTFCGTSMTITPACPSSGSGSTVNLAAPTTNRFFTSTSPTPGLLNGILLYRQGQASGESASSPGVAIADPGGAVLLNGGMYFPNSIVFYEANTNPLPLYSPACSILVAGSLTLGALNVSDNQTNPTQFDDAGCGSFGTPVPNVQQAQVIE
jgi:Flp pilus assembly protein TadG